MENPTHSFRGTNLVLQLVKESQIKGICLRFMFYLIVQCIECTFRIYIFLHIKKLLTLHIKLLHTLSLLVSKIVESLQCILNGKYYPLYRNLENILKEMHVILNCDQKYQKSFPNVAVIVFKNSKNLRLRKVKAVLLNNDKVGRSKPYA